MPRRLRNARLAPALVAGVAAAQLGLVPAHVRALEMAAQQEPAMGTVASELAAPAASALQHLNLPSMLQVCCGRGAAPACLPACWTAALPCGQPNHPKPTLSSPS